MQKIINGLLVDLTPGEVVAREAEIAAAVARTKPKAKAELAAIRYAKETGGATVNGSPVATDRETQAKLIAVRIKAKENPAYTVNWKTPAGFVSFDAPTIIAIADGVADHIQACFDREAALTASIDAAADQAALDAIDLTVGWP